MIAITGATGKLGGAVVKALLEKAPGTHLVASAREPEKAQALAALGVEVRHGDFSLPETLGAAFRGATQVLLISSNAAAYGGNPLEQHHAAIEAAKKAGVKRVLYTSHMAASASSLFPPMLTHAKTEAMLAASGMRWTALRNGFYASSALDFIGDGLKAGRITLPADGKVVWTSHADLAVGSAAVLAQEGSFDGPLPLTASVALDMSDIARTASQVLGREVQREVLSDEAFEEQLKSQGVPSA
ncbi:MAG TPA: NAD(P)H-binding protein, partial [Polyangiaceae bacterium]|nr:NAD(P)H-binding protein [Polyangiaceae bacterium]